MSNRETDDTQPIHVPDPPSTQRPSKGRVVLFVENPDWDPMTALIADVYTDRMTGAILVNLAVFDPCLSG